MSQPVPSSQPVQSTSPSGGSSGSSTVLARKYRPRNFSELVGQSHVARALEGALQRGRLHHAYLFTGTRGVGKTTIARILAKCLNCETGITATPCGVCQTCVAIDQGRYIDRFVYHTRQQEPVDLLLFNTITKSRMTGMSFS